ncbi:hypothetical protein P353_16845 [Comamonas testosteroni]|uniref:Uncharacterized protein n=1 Tax=Comamonas testosteroni TaxID=285 RepID=A0A096FDA1_COMTE|nr:hypothetical protein P353_16845 [Comamonas testosteroni]
MHSTLLKTRSQQLSHRIAQRPSGTQMKKLAEGKDTMRTHGVVQQIGRHFIDSRFLLINVWREQLLRQHIKLLHAVALANHQVALHEQLVECSPTRAMVPPHTFAFGAFLQIACFQYSFSSHTGKDFRHKSFIDAPEVGALTTTKGEHAWQRKPVVAHRQVSRCVKPVFEYFSSTRQLIEVLQSIVRHPIPENMVMCTLHNGQRVYLHVAQMLNRSQGTSKTLTEFLARPALETLVQAVASACAVLELPRFLLMRVPRELLRVITYFVPVRLFLHEFVKKVAERQFVVKAIRCNGERFAG